LTRQSRKYGRGIVPDKTVVVVDTNTLLQSLLNDSGPAGKCFGYFRRGEIDIVVSRDTMGEAREVLSRSHLRVRYPQLTEQKVAHLINFLLYRGTYLHLRNVHIAVFNCVHLYL
jgi:predicted nucleic acid-binding protein